MIRLALWLIAVGAADLVRGGGEPRGRREALAVLAGGALPAAGLAALGESPTRALLFGLTSGAAIAVHLWLRRSEQAGRAPRFALVAVWLGAITALLALPIRGGVAAAPSRLGAWLEGSRWLAAAGLDAGELLLVLGGAVVLLATANVLVRGVLLATGVELPQAEGELRGGHLIGPLERLLIYGLALAGQWTGAALIASAKSLLRFPELTREDQARIHTVTEYFLLGSLTSWLVALAVAGFVRLALA
jgi:hypothetical protein